jgi:TatD DNase family protein
VIDSHCHLTYPGLVEKLDEVIEKSRETLKAIITVGFPFEGEKRERKEVFEGALAALGLSERFPGFIFVTLGLHPTQVPDMTEEEIEEYVEFIRRNKERIVGVGEIGLDRFWIKDEDTYKRTLEVFHRMLELAEEIGKPVVIHSRKAEEEAVEVLLSHSLKSGVLMHSYTGNMTAAKKALDNGFFFSVNYKLTNNKNMRKIAKNFSLEYLLTETDSPFLSETNEVNTPLQIKLIVEEISRLRGLSFSEVDEITTSNAVKFYKLPL